MSSSPTLLRLAIGIACALFVATSWSAPEPATVPVESFEVTGNTLLGRAEIDAALARFKGPRTLDELRQAAAAVQELYRRAGFGAVVVFVPEQTPVGGRVRISVLEGKVAKVVVTGNRHFSAEAVRRMLPALKEGTTPDSRRLDRQIQLANDNPAHQLAVTLEPGAARGDVDVTVAVTERAVSRGSIEVDNTGDEQTGDWRATLGWRHDDVGGRDHQAAVQLQTSPTQPADVVIVTATYGVPLYRQGLRLDGYAAYSDVDGGTTPTVFGSLQFAGRGNVLGLRLSGLAPRWGEFEQRLAAGLDRREYRNQCSIAGLPPGSCGSAGESVTAHPFALEYQLQTGGARAKGLYASVTRNLGLGGRYSDSASFDRARPGAPLRYTIARLGAFATAPVGGDWNLRGRAQVQATGDALIPGEQFALAGAKAVRGYAEREVAGDRGALASVELTSPDLLARRDGDPPGGLRASLFADGGEVENLRDAECRRGRTRCSLLGYGIALTWARWPAALRLDAARAARQGTLTDRGDWRLHVAASWSLE